MSHFPASAAPVTPSAGGAATAGPSTAAGLTAPGEPGEGTVGKPVLVVVANGQDGPALSNLVAAERGVGILQEGLVISSPTEAEAQAIAADANLAASGGPSAGFVFLDLR